MDVVNWSKPSTSRGLQTENHSGISRTNAVRGARRGERGESQQQQSDWFRREQPSAHLHLETVGSVLLRFMNEQT
jgi:hypothetical protein